MTRSNTESPTRRRLLDVAEAADYLGSTERHVRRLVTERRMPFAKIGGKLRFSPDALDAWIAENSHEPEDR